MFASSQFGSAVVSPRLEVGGTGRGRVTLYLAVLTSLASVLLSLPELFGVKILALPLGLAFFRRLHAQHRE